MGNLAVGNADGPQQVGELTLPIGPGVAYIYDLTTEHLRHEYRFPGSKSYTAYGIWQNGSTNYTICGGYSPLAVNNLRTKLPLTQGKGYLVDYDSSRNTFSNWTSFNYPNGPAGVNFITHFEGISSTEPGVYTVCRLCSDRIHQSRPRILGLCPPQSDGTFDKGTWVDLNYPNSPGRASPAAIRSMAIRSSAW